MSGRPATTDVRPGRYALSVGMPETKPPKGWRWVALYEVAKMATGHTPSRRHPEYWGGNIPWMNVADARFCDGGLINETKETTNKLGIENSAAVLLPVGTVCLSRTGSIGYVVVMGRPMATSQGYVNWICKSDLLPRFLQLIFKQSAHSFMKYRRVLHTQPSIFPKLRHSMCASHLSPISGGSWGRSRSSFRGWRRGWGR